MALTVADFRAAYPEFASTSDALLERYLGEASLYVNACWGDRQEAGTFYYMAHTAQLEADRVAAGIDASGRGTTSIGSGSHKVTVGQTSKDANGPGYPWTKTRYGRLFWELMQRCSRGRIYAV